jgi:hypothetical protein
MKLLAISSTWAVVLALALCLAPKSYGQHMLASEGRIGGSGQAEGTFPLAVTLRPATAVLNSQLFEFDKKKKKDGGGSKAVPEGGSPFTYLGIAGSVGLGTLLLTRRRRTSIPS